MNVLAKAALEKIEEPIRLSSYNLAIERTVRKFQDFCTTRGFGGAFPVTAVPLGAYLVFRFNIYMNCKFFMLIRFGKNFDILIPFIFINLSL